MKILFSHIPKCGGTSVWKWFADCCGSSASVFWSRVPGDPLGGFDLQDFNAFRVIGGHFGINNQSARQFESVSGESFFRAVFLRDPFARLVSFYRYCRERGFHELHLVESFGDAVENGNICRTQTANACKRFDALTFPAAQESMKEFGPIIVGAIESPDAMLTRLAEIIGNPAPELHRINRSIIIEGMPGEETNAELERFREHPLIIEALREDQQLHDWLMQESGGVFEI